MRVLVFASENREPQVFDVSTHSLREKAYETMFEQLDKSGVFEAVDRYDAASRELIRGSRLGTQGYAHALMIVIQYDFHEGLVKFFEAEVK